jgi:hypothetical protein
MNSQILVVMEKQVGFGASINILSNQISLLMGLLSDTQFAELSAPVLRLRRPTPISFNPK